MNNQGGEARGEKRRRGCLDNTRTNSRRQKKAIFGRENASCLMFDECVVDANDTDVPHIDVTDTAA